MQLHTNCTTNGYLILHTANRNLIIATSCVLRRACIFCRQNEVKPKEWIEIRFFVTEWTYFRKIEAICEIFHDFSFVEEIFKNMEFYYADKMIFFFDERHLIKEYCFRKQNACFDWINLLDPTGLSTSHTHMN